MDRKGLDRCTKRTDNTISLTTNDLKITYWPKIQQLEMFTRRGHSFIVMGQDTKDFIKWFHDNICDEEVPYNG